MYELGKAYASEQNSQQQYRNENYEIGWICALRTELAAARAMLDEDRGIAQYNETGDSNTYALGRIHQHNVVIACLPTGIDGTNAAATVAQNMLRTFPLIRIGLLVGIGGGIPDLARGIDIRLGDVVVSQPDGEHGGVIQYAKGKWQQDDTGLSHKFVRKGSLNKPPIFILKALNMLRAEHEIEDSKIPTFLREMLDRKPKMRKTGYTFPGEDKDRLLGSSGTVMQANNSEVNTSSTDLTEVTRAPRDSIDPVIHYGTIASGDLVVKHADFRDALRDSFGALCVEMEAAGIMDTFPCLVIRGICDYADSFKNDVWHPYAAAVAAAYAKELLLYISPQQVHQGPAASEIIDSKTHVLLEQSLAIHERTLQHHTRVAEELQTRDERERILKCHQSFACVYAEYKDVNPERAPGTCEWVLKHRQFQSWQSSEHADLLWISADPGCGKSVLAKTLIDHELKGTKKNVCYFFFKDNVQQDRVRIALKALLHQLFNQQPHLLKHAIPIWDTKGGNASYEVDEMWRIFLSVTSDPLAGLTYCVLDALDECREDDRRTLITMVSDHYRTRSPQITQGILKFLITSRPYTSVERWFNPVVAELPQIRLRGEDENDHIHQEINLVINQRVDELAKDFLLSSVNRKWLLQKLVCMEHRTYLWLHLAIDDIRKAYENSLIPGDVRIESVPISVNDAYERMLERISAAATPNARKVLMIILGAQRPLTIAEMALALMASSNYDTQSSSIQLPNTIRLKEQIRQWCGLFVFINHSKLFLIHQTAKEFLLADGLTGSISTYSWKSSLAMAEINLVLAKLCIQYLLQNESGAISPTDGDHPEDPQNQDLKVQMPSQAEQREFFTYCASHWATHLDDQYVVEDRTLLSRVMSLCDAQTKLFKKWFPILWTRLNGSTLGEPPQVSEQHLFALTGHCALLTELYKREEFDVNARDTEGRTALLWASERGNDTVVSELLDAGADMNLQGGTFGSPLHAASANGHEIVTRTLLNRGADTNHLRYSSVHHRTWNGLTPLSLAVVKGRVQIVKLLLQQDGIDVNIKGESGMNAILLAARHGRLKVAKLLLEISETDVNTTDVDGYTPLAMASENDDLKMVALLLEYDNVDANSRGKNGQSPLSLAALSGNIKLMETLLKCDSIDVNCRDSNGRTILSQAKERGQFAVVDLLCAHSSSDIHAKGTSEPASDDKTSKRVDHCIPHLDAKNDADSLSGSHLSISQDEESIIPHGQGETRISQHVSVDPDLDNIIEKLLALRASQPRSNGLALLERKEIVYLCEKASEVFLEQPSLLELEGSITICGDVRGYYTTLLHIFDTCGHPPETFYLFLGNYVDRGPQSLETICLLLAFKIKYPEMFFLLRGNHECESLTRIYGFYDECKRRFSFKLWKVIMKCFNCMPFAAVIDDQIFASHSGISPDLNSMDQILAIERPTTIPDTGLLCDLTWSSPNPNITGWSEYDRGVSYEFGPDVVTQFLEKHNFSLMCRSHNILQDGYEFFSDRKLVTLWSLVDYHSEFNNIGAVMRVDENLLCSFCVFKPASRT